MDIDIFIQRRIADWDHLESLLDERDQETPCTTDDIQQLINLYRRTTDDLARARALTVNPDILGRLRHLTQRAYSTIYGGSKTTWNTYAVVDFFIETLPQTLVRCRRFVVTAMALLLLGGAIGFGAAWQDPDRIRLILPDMFYHDSPADRVERIESGEERIEDLVQASTFAAELYTHNIKVSFLVFALSAISIIGGWYVLVYNGLILGAITAQYFTADQTLFFISWVGPHGALELPAIGLAAAAGLRLGPALLLPGHVGRRHALREAAPDAVRLITGAMVMLVFAGAIEGSFSQFSSKTVAYPIKIMFAILLFGTVYAYLSGRIRRNTPQP